MSRVTSYTLIGLLLASCVLWLSGGIRVVEFWALDGQRRAQSAMAAGLRALRAGEPAALTGFLIVCFSYGFFHAAGPGHGKILIGAYGAARAIGAWKLSLIALASSLAQAVSAIALVGGGLFVWQLGRTQMTDLAERVFAPVSFAAIALVGMWLVWRGLRSMRIAHVRLDETHAPVLEGVGAPCSQCGHHHAPDPDAILNAGGWRDVVVLISAVALRPCTGALFVLILTAQMGIFHVGLAGTFAMALGTASITGGVAVASVLIRHSVVSRISGIARLEQIQPAIEIGVGGCVAVLGIHLSLASL